MSQLRRLANDAIERSYEIDESAGHAAAAIVGHAYDLAVADLAAHPREDWESSDAVRAFMSLVRRDDEGGV